MANLLDDNSIVARYCKPKHLSEDQAHILPVAFYLRRKENEDDLSVFWLDLYGNPREEDNIQSLRIDLPKALNPSRNSILGLLDVGSSKHRVMSEVSVGLDFIHTPGRLNSHSSILGMNCDEHDAIASELADMANERNRYPAL